MNIHKDPLINDAAEILAEAAAQGMPDKDAMKVAMTKVLTALKLKANRMEVNVTPGRPESSVYVKNSIAPGVTLGIEWEERHGTSAKATVLFNKGGSDVAKAPLSTVLNKPEEFLDRVKASLKRNFNVTVE